MLAACWHLLQGSCVVYGYRNASTSTNSSSCHLVPLSLGGPDPQHPVPMCSSLGDSHLPPLAGLPLPQVACIKTCPLILVWCWVGRREHIRRGTRIALKGSHFRTVFQLTSSWRGGPSRQGHGVSRDLGLQGFQVHPPE